MNNEKLIEEIVKRAKKELQADTFEDLDEFKEINFWCPSGIPDLDWLMLTFGYNPGIMEVAGKSRSGKTTLLLHAIDEIIRLGGVPFVLSTERRENRDNAIRMGIDPTKVTRKKVKTIEEAFDKATKYIEIARNVSDKIPILIGIDSLGGTPTKAELNAKEDQEFMAIAARVIKGRLRRITQLIDDENIILFVNNQTYSKIGMVFGKKSESYGGEGLKFHRQLGIDVVKLSTLKDSKGNKFGQITRLELTKSDFTLPEQYIDVPLLWGYGYIPSKEILNLGVENDVLEKYGKAGYNVKKIPKIRWKNDQDYYRLMISNPAYRVIIKKILTNMVHKEIKIQRGLK